MVKVVSMFIMNLFFPNILSITVQSTCSSPRNCLYLCKALHTNICYHSFVSPDYILPIFFLPFHQKRQKQESNDLVRVVLEETLESPLDCKEIQPVHSKGDQSWVFFGRNDAKASSTLATSCEELSHWKRLWCWEGLGTGGKGDNRGWHGWMASLTRWTWVWVNSRSWWWTGRPDVLWFM